VEEYLLCARQKEGDDTPMDNPDAIELGSDDEDNTMKEG
jgi:hypothetical protein